MTKSKIKALIFFFFMNLILVDFGNQIRKLSFNDALDNYSNPVFSIAHTVNTGAGFGIFQNNSMILSLFSLFVILFIAYFVYKKITFQNKVELFSLTLFCAGAIGNMIERINFSHVVDYIKLNFINFPIFNAFDIMICAGAFIYCTYILFFLKDDKNEDSN